MPNTPEGFNQREHISQKPEQAKAEIVDVANVSHVAKARLEKAGTVSKNAQKEMESTQLAMNELDAKVHASAQKHGAGEMIQPSPRIDLAARVTPSRFSDLPYPTNDDINSSSPGNQEKMAPNPYDAVQQTTNSASEHREVSKGSLRNLYDMMRMKPTVLGITSLSNFAKEIKLDERAKQIVLSPTVMAKLASLANIHGDDLLQSIDRDNPAKSLEVDGSGFIQEKNVGKVTAEWKKLVAMVSASRSANRRR